MAPPLLLRFTLLFSQFGPMFRLLDLLLDDFGGTSKNLSKN